MKSSSWATFGGLGPDVSRDELVLKNSVRRKMREYSNTLRAVNRSCIRSKENNVESYETVAHEQSTRPPRVDDEAQQPITACNHRRSAEICMNTPQLDKFPTAVIRELLLEYESLNAIVTTIRVRYTTRADPYLILSCVHLHTRSHQ